MKIEINGALNNPNFLRICNDIVRELTKKKANRDEQKLSNSQTELIKYCSDNGIGCNVDYQADDTLSIGFMKTS